MTQAQTQEFRAYCPRCGEMTLAYDRSNKAFTCTNLQCQLVLRVAPSVVVCPHCGATVLFWTWDDPGRCSSCGRPLHGPAGPCVRPMT